ncbi:pitrilysin family protein [Parvularcula sp. IMCC14364]|uniref:M16 family metallopeptidase n=1 Tax=Parvularcula sp. IMCC14364 TaxID=3067902 RepID=UPI0027414B9C|nr:pitrilysin family protein [Parvularcula sp. IMCC14364]
MKLKHLLLLGTMAALTACENTPVSTQTNTAAATAADKFELDYEKFTLDNGLEVILHRDTSDPIVAVTTVIHAGSNREKPGRTGFAHFFEHMAFNDSENVPRGWNRKAIPDWGGQRNGGTWSDGTIYYEVVPKDAFDKILWIDSDRLGYMINTVTQAALDAEIQVVKNEKRQRYDNAPYGYTTEVIRKNLYPEGHPYSWTTIGLLPDLQAATLEDLKEFYTEYYGAANATLVIAGDIDLEETTEKVARWFGEIRRGPDVAPLEPMPANLTETKTLWFEDNFARLPELRITIPTVEDYHPDALALNVLGQILGGSKNSPLYREIVDTRKLAPNVSSYSSVDEIAGTFTIRVRGKADTDLDDVMDGIETALADFEANGVDPKDLQRIKAEQETILYSGLSTVLGKSNTMAIDNEFAGDPAYAIKQAELLTAVTAEDVMRVYDTYIDDKPAVITSFVPKGKADLAIEGSALAEVFIEEVKADNASENVTRGEIGDYEKTPSKYDRSEPPFGELPLVSMPDVWEASFGDGIRVLGIENSETPLVTFDITINGGGSLDPLAQKGVSSLLARLMNEGTATRTAAELEQAIGLLGSGISVSASAEEVTISATSLARNFEDTVALVEEILAQPRWEEADFERVKSAALTAITGREANPNAIASLSFNKLIYGDAHPLGLPTDGTAETVSTLTLTDLQDHYARMKTMSPRIHIAGAVSQARAEAAFATFADDFAAPDQPVPTYDIPEQNTDGTTYFIDVPGSKQSVLYIGKLTVPTAHPDFNKIQFTNEKLGGGISGDLAQTLRIEKGYTYGAYSSIGNGLTARPFIAGTSVRANATKDSLMIIEDMISSYGETFTQADVETTQSKLIKENTRAFESLNAKLGTLRQISKYGKSNTYVEDEQQELISMQLDDFRKIAATYLDEEEMIYLVVGDKETQFGPVTEFATGDVIELDIYGERVE